MNGVNRALVNHYVAAMMIVEVVRFAMDYRVLQVVDQI
jgi:hypothetical protein